MLNPEEKKRRITSMDKKRILIIEDNNLERILIKCFLSQASGDYLISEARNGDEALEFLENDIGKVDLMLLDINMPGMNGHEFLKNYSQQKRSENSTVWMLTSSIEESDKQLSLDYPFVKAYLSKPFNLDLASQVDQELNP